MTESTAKGFYLKIRFYSALFILTGIENAAAVSGQDKSLAPSRHMRFEYEVFSKDQVKLSV